MSPEESAMFLGILGDPAAVYYVARWHVLVYTLMWRVLQITLAIICSCEIHAVSP